MPSTYICPWCAVEKPLEGYYIAQTTNVRISKCRACLITAQQVKKRGAPPPPRLLNVNAVRSDGLVLCGTCYHARPYTEFGVSDKRHECASCYADRPVRDPVPVIRLSTEQRREREREACPCFVCDKQSGCVLECGAYKRYVYTGK